MHEYTETESKHTDKIGTHSMWEQMYMSYFAYACKTEGKNDISHLISETA